MDKLWTEREVKLVEEITTYLLIALVLYLVRLALFTEAEKKRDSVVEALAQTIGSSPRKDWKLRRMTSGLRTDLETSSNHMFGAPSQISCMTSAKSFSVLVSQLPTCQMEVINLVKKKILRGKWRTLSSLAALWLVGGLIDSLNKRDWMASWIIQNRNKIIGKKLLQST